MSGATIRAHRLFADELKPAHDTIEKTDGSGRFNFELDPGEYFVEARDEAHAPAATVVNIKAGEARPLALTTVRGGSIKGRVLDRDGIPLSGALVTVDGEIPLGSVISDWHPVAAQTSDTGEFMLRPLRPGNVRVTAHRSGFSQPEPAVFFLPLAGQIADATIVLARGLDLSGHVMNRVDLSSPLSGIGVGAMDVLTGTTVMARALSARDGQFTISGLYPGTFLVNVSPPGTYPLWASTRVTLRDDGADPVIVTASPTFSIDGMLTRGAERISVERLGDALRDPAWSAIRRHVVDTDASGHFAIGGLPPGKFMLHARGIDGGCLEAPVDVTNANVHDVRFRTKPGGSIVGVLRDAQNTGLAGARIELVPAVLSADGRRYVAEGSWRKASLEADRAAQSQHFQARHVLTARDGTFEASCLEPGSFELTAYLGDRQLEWRHPGRFGGPPTSAMIELRSTTDSVRADLEVRACMSVVMGEVVDSEGRPANGAWVSAFRTSGSTDGTPAGGVFSEATGRYRLAGLCAGSYRIVARALTDDRVAIASSVELPPGQTKNVRLGLDRGASVRGTIKFRGTPVRSFGVLMTGPDMRTRYVEALDGAFREASLLPGGYSTVVESSQGYGASRIDLSPGEVRDVDVDLTPWSVVAGKVIDERGAAIPDLPVQIAFRLADGSSKAEMGSPSAVLTADGSSKAEVGWPSAERFRATKTDSTGHFTIDRTIAREGRLTFGAPGSEEIVVSVSGIVASSAPPQTFPGVAVTIVPKPGQTLDEGTVIIEDRK